MSPVATACGASPWDQRPAESLLERSAEPMKLPCLAPLTHSAEITLGLHQEAPVDLEPLIAAYDDSVTWSIDYAPARPPPGASGSDSSTRLSVHADPIQRRPRRRRGVVIDVLQVAEPTVIDEQDDLARHVVALRAHDSLGRRKPGGQT